MDTILPFGKHKGLTVKQVLAKSPSYIRWAIQNVENFELSSEDEDIVFEQSAIEDDHESIGCFDCLGDYC